MQANRAMYFQKCLTKSGRREGSIMESFIIDVAERGSGRIAELADTASRERSPWILAFHASIRLLAKSILLPAHRAA